jgi:hypothetical protein
MSVFGFEGAMHRPGKVGLLSHFLTFISISVCYQHQQATSFATGACLELGGLRVTQRYPLSEFLMNLACVFFLLSFSFSLGRLCSALGLIFRTVTHCHEFYATFIDSKSDSFCVNAHPRLDVISRSSVFYCHVSIQGGGSLIQVCSRVDETISPLLCGARGRKDLSGTAQW